MLAWITRLVAHLTDTRGIPVRELVDWQYQIVEAIDAKVAEICSLFGDDVGSPHPLPRVPLRRGRSKGVALYPSAAATLDTLKKRLIGERWARTTGGVFAVKERMLHGMDMRALLFQAIRRPGVAERHAHASLLAPAASDLLGLDQRVNWDPLQDPHAVAEQSRHGAADRFLKRRVLGEPADQLVHQIGGEGGDLVEAEYRLDMPRMAGVFALRGLREVGALGRLLEAVERVFEAAVRKLRLWRADRLIPGARPPAPALLAGMGEWVRTASGAGLGCSES